MTTLDEAERSPEPKATLQYATPDHRSSRGGVTFAVIAVLLFVCIACVSIFALVIHEHQDAWAAAGAVAALAAMGVFVTFFLTRQPTR